MYKKLTSILLTFIMLFATMIMSVSAVEEDMQIAVVEKNLDTSVVSKITSSKNAQGEISTEILDSWVDESSAQVENATTRNVISDNLMVSPRNIVNPTDGRTVVQNTRMFPYSAIVELEVFFGLRSYTSTGFFISNDVVATAAHCIYKKDLGWATNVTVRPGRNGTMSLPYGLATAQALSISIQYYEEPGNANFDWGAIKLNPGIIGNPGHFSLTTVSASTSLSDITARISGYPGDMVSDIFTDHKQYEMVGTGCTYSGTQLCYKIDTSSGQSGAPILNMNNQVIGIHTNGDSLYNKGVRMTDVVIYYLTDFIERHQ